jgi:hypothetical protein
MTLIIILLLCIKSLEAFTCTSTEAHTEILSNLYTDFDIPNCKVKDFNIK